MKVKDLIAKLSSMDQDALVISSNYNGSIHPTAPIAFVKQFGLKDLNTLAITDSNRKPLKLGKSVKNVVYIDIWNML